MYQTILLIFILVCLNKTAKFGDYSELPNGVLLIIIQIWLNSMMW